MTFSLGIILVAAAIAMIFFGRARGGQVLPIFKVWIVGQLYVMAAMTLGVFGIADLIINWPF
jgi:hypothetical protein